MTTGGLTVAGIANSFDINLIYARRLFQSIDTNDDFEAVQKMISHKPKPFVKWVGGLLNYDSR
jgi:hypothetical protein